MNLGRKSFAAVVVVMAYVHAGGASAAAPITLKFHGFVEHGLNFTGPPIGPALGSEVTITVVLNPNSPANDKVTDPTTEASYTGGGCSLYYNDAPVVSIMIAGKKIGPGCYNNVFVNKGYGGQTQISISGFNSERQGAFGFTFTSSNTKLLTSTAMPTAIDTTKLDTSNYNVQSFGPNSNASTYFSGDMTNPP